MASRFAKYTLMLASVTLVVGGTEDPQDTDPPLYAAIRANNSEAVLALLKAKPSLAKGPVHPVQKAPPLYFACLRPNPDARIAEALIENGAPYGTEKMSGASYLQFAVMGGGAGLIDVLLKHGGKDLLDKQDGEGATALMIAASTLNVDVVRVLLKHGANPTLTDYEFKRKASGIPGAYGDTCRGDDCIEAVLLKAEAEWKGRVGIPKIKRKGKRKKADL